MSIVSTEERCTVCDQQLTMKSAGFISVPWCDSYAKLLLCRDSSFEVLLHRNEEVTIYVGNLLKLMQEENRCIASGNLYFQVKPSFQSKS